MFIKISEQPSLYNDLEKKSVHEILVDINREDQKVALAIQKTIPQIEKLVTQIVPRMKQRTGIRRPPATRPHPTIFRGVVCLRTL